MIKTNVASLTLDINKILEKAKENGALVARKLVLELQTRVMLKSPVDTGRLRNNWNVGISHIDTTSHGADKSGVEASTRGLAELSKFNLGNTVWITNSLPYVYKLEFGLYGKGDKTVNGFSTQAPHGFIRITHQEITAAFESIAKKVIK